MAATFLAGHVPLWIDVLCCLTSGPVKLLSWKKKSRYRSFSWSETGDLQSVHVSLCEVPFHFLLCIHMDSRAINCGWWYGFQMLWEPGAGLGAVSCVQRTPWYSLCRKGADIPWSDSSLCSCCARGWEHFCKASGRVPHHWKG